MRLAEVKLIIAFLLFITLSVSGIFMTDYVLNNRDASLALSYCLVPSIILALIYSYKGTFGYNPFIAKWRNVFGMVTFSFIITIVFVAAFQGYILSINKMWVEEKVLLKGTVVRIDIRQHAIRNNYSIDLVDY